MEVDEELSRYGNSNIVHCSIVIVNWLCFADQKAAGLIVQQALHEYGQLLRHPYMFGEMPMDERYDVFLSMSKLLKIMGFQQRAELLLYGKTCYYSHSTFFQVHCTLS